MCQGDTEFLKANAFLFLFFRAEVYWYGLVFIVRGFVLAMAPVVPNIIGHMFLVLFVVLSNILATVHFAPWAVAKANFVEVLTCISY